MTWERRLFDLFDDLEQRAEGLALDSRDAEVAELARAEYAEIPLASRLHASVGRSVEVQVAGVPSIRGVVDRVGADWLLLTDVSDEWVVPVAALLGLRGLADGARAEEARGVLARLRLGSALRGLAEDRSEVVVLRTDGSSRAGRVARVGADFVELAVTPTNVELVPFLALSAVRCRRS